MGNAIPLKDSSPQGEIYRFIAFGVRGTVSIHDTAVRIELRSAAGNHHETISLLDLSPQYEMRTETGRGLYLVPFLAFSVAFGLMLAPHWILVLCLVTTVLLGAFFWRHPRKVWVQFSSIDGRPIVCFANTGPDRERFTDFRDLLAASIENAKEQQSRGGRGETVLREGRFRGCSIKIAVANQFLSI